MQTLTQETFKEAISEGRVLVDFWADWCDPCRAMNPILEDLDRSGVIAVAKVNIDQETRLPIEYDVYSVPTMVVFEDGEERMRVIGARPLKEMQDLLFRLDN